MYKKSKNDKNNKLKMVLAIKMVKLENKYKFISKILIEKEAIDFLSKK
ncbi:hypothetical protein [Blattabacterium cuenoti]|nr:hypothetical protein [Blattabacterium cuenoti]